MNIVDRDWFKTWTKSSYPQTIKETGRVLSIYSPYFLTKGEDNGSYTAAVTFGVFKKADDKNNMILFSFFPPALLNSHQLLLHSQNLCNDYLNNSLLKTHQERSPDILIVPGEQGIRNSLISDINAKNNDVPIRRFYYDKYGSTLDNILSKALPKIASGKVWVVAKPGDSQELRNMDEKFLEVVSGYPSQESKATVWALSQAVLYLESYGVFRDEEDKKDGIIKPKHAFYGVETI